MLIVLLLVGIKYSQVFLFFVGLGDLGHSVKL